MMAAWTSRFRLIAMRCLLYGIVLALLTFVCFSLGLSLTTAAFVFLTAIVLLSLRAGFISAAIFSIVAVGCLDYYFSPPIFSFQFDYPQDAVVLTAFFLTTLIITRLVESLRSQTDAARMARMAEATAAQSERKFRRAVDTMPALIWTALPNGSSDFFNERWLAYTGLSLEQALGWSWTDVYHPEDRALVETLRKALASGELTEGEARLRGVDGTYRWFLIRAVPLRDEAGSIIKWCGSATDIHDRKRAEEELRRSEAFLAEGQRLSHTGSWGWNSATGKFICSEEYCRIFGFNRTEEPIFQSFQASVHPEDRALVQRTLDRAIHGRSGFSIEFRVTLPDGSFRDIHGMGHPVLTETGDLNDYIGIMMDITERKRSEEALHNAHTELSRVARLTMVGELMASIAHEIHQPLGAMVASGNACLRWLAKDQPQLDDARFAAERIVRDGHRAGNILKSVRALVGDAAPDMTEFDINNAIRDVLVLARSELHEHDIQLESELSDGLAPVMGNKVQLQQVVLNLIMNAVEAMSPETNEPRLLRIRTQGDGPGAVLIAVEDSGPGIAPESVDRLFEAFFTTKPTGMGMGLSICRSIINAHGGRLWVSPGSPRGAVFQFTVPVAAKSGMIAHHASHR
jgi:PAS domain S-box-containing protein